MADARPDPTAQSIDPRSTGRRDGALWLHATALAVQGKGLLILGASGSGKSSLAIELIALGAALIADDGIWLQTASDPPILERPDTATDRIEARHIGLIGAGPTLARAPLVWVIDLDRAETDRFPPARSIALGDRSIPVLHAKGQHGLAPALSLLLRHGRAEP